MARTGSATEIAATGADASLWFDWIINGTPAWGTHEIAGPWRAYGPPAITADAAATEVARPNGRAPSAICPWTPPHRDLQRYKVTHDGTRRKRPG
jgi:hypothetical protein